MYTGQDGDKENAGGMANPTTTPAAGEIFAARALQPLLSVPTDIGAPSALPAVVRASVGAVAAENSGAALDDFLVYEDPMETAPTTKAHPGGVGAATTTGRRENSADDDGEPAFAAFSRPR